MFDIGWGELLLIGMVALIAIGPKELPGALRSLGQWMGKVRRMASEFQNQFHEAMREAELHDLKKEVDEMASQASKMAHFDPLDDVRKDLEATKRDIESGVQVPSLDEPPPASEVPVAVTSSHGEAGSALGPSVDMPVSPDAAPATAAPAPITSTVDMAAATARPESSVAPAQARSPLLEGDPAGSGVKSGAETPATGRAPA